MIINRQIITKIRKSPLFLLVNMVLVGILWYLSRQALVVPAIFVLLAVDLWPVKDKDLVAMVKDRLVRVIIGISVIFIIALLPKAVTQIVVASLYLFWRCYAEQPCFKGRLGMWQLLATQMVVLEAIFLVLAFWQWPRSLILAVLWISCFVIVRRALLDRGEQAAELLAATWGLIAVEMSWVLMRWLVSYISPGNYLIVPQPVVIIGVLAYCFGSIYIDQRLGKLNRSRLIEYLLLGLVIIWVVIIGTKWQGTL